MTDEPIETRCSDIDHFCSEVTARLDAAAVGFGIGQNAGAARLIEKAGRIAWTHLVEAGVLEESDQS